MFDPSLALSFFNNPLMIQTMAAAAFQARVHESRTAEPKRPGPSFLISDILNPKTEEEEEEEKERELKISDSHSDGACSSGEPSPNSSSEKHLPASMGLLRGQNSPGKKPRKARTIFTDKQLQSLEESFEKQKYLSVQDRMDLAQRMNLSDTQVKTWYQNRRTKWKRQTSVGFELLGEAGNLAAVQMLRNSPYWSSYLGAHPGFLPPSTPLAPNSFRFWPPPGPDFPPLPLPQHIPPPLPSATSASTPPPTSSPSSGKCRN